MQPDDVTLKLDSLDRGLAWAQTMQRDLHRAGHPTRVSADESGAEVLVPFRGMVYSATVKVLAEMAARHAGSIVVDFAQAGVRFLPPRVPAQGEEASRG